MNSKEKRMSLIFAMFFVAALIITVSFNEGVEGQAVKQFNSLTEKNNYCESFCDEEMNKKETEFGSWIDCHEKCIKN